MLGERRAKSDGTGESQSLWTHSDFSFSSCLDMDVFSKCRSLPLSLARGDVEANLEHLNQLDVMPAAPTACKIKVMLSVGYLDSTSPANTFHEQLNIRFFSINLKMLRPMQTIFRNYY